MKAREAARSDLMRARDVAAVSEARLVQIADVSARLRDLEDPLAAADLARRIEDLSKAIAAAQGHRDRCARAASDLKSRRLEAQAAREAFDKAKAAQGRATELEQALSDAQVLSAEITELAKAFNDNGATPQRIAQLENARILSAREQQALEGMSTFVEIVPAEGAQGKIKADGAPVMHAARLPVPERLTVEIAGIGSIRVISSDAERAAQTARRRDESHKTIARLLDEMDVVDDAQACAKAAQRVDTGARLDTLRLRFAEVAPRGIAVLETELSDLAAVHAQYDEARLAAALEDGNAAVRAAQQAYESMVAEGVDEARFRIMAGELDAARREVTRRQDEARRTSELLERLRGEQAGVDEEGRAGEVERFSGLLEQAEETVRRCETDIAALKLLSATLARSIEDVRTRYLEPVTNALLPYLKQVFPGAGVAFRDTFSLEALMRAGEREEFASLSDGTREQLAVLVRMGFAELFAARRVPIPLVLDDPLVYSDDDRLKAMCGALNDAGRGYQIVVLTCRQTAFTALDAHRLTLAPWSGS